jgi:hypothetical protein
MSECDKPAWWATIIGITGYEETVIVRGDNTIEAINHLLGVRQVERIVRLMPAVEM